MSEYPSLIRGYRALIAEAIGQDDPATLALVEEIMRCDRPTLDALTRAQFTQLARRSMVEAVAMAATADDPDNLAASMSLATFCEISHLQLPSWAAAAASSSR